MSPSWVDDLVTLKETEHFKLCYDGANELAYDSFKHGETYFIIYKPLNQIEHAHESYNVASSLLLGAEDLYNQLSAVFDLRSGNVLDGNKLN
jgi:hypothetical protein